MIGIGKANDVSVNEGRSKLRDLSSVDHQPVIEAVDAVAMLLVATRKEPCSGRGLGGCDPGSQFKQDKGAAAAQAGALR